jgi:hypothetical protein
VARSRFHATVALAARHPHRLGHGDLTTTTRYVKILDEEDGTPADVVSELLIPSKMRRFAAVNMPGRKGRPAPDE